MADYNLTDKIIQFLIKEDFINDYESWLQEEQDRLYEGIQNIMTEHEVNGNDNN